MVVVAAVILFAVLQPGAHSWRAGKLEGAAAPSWSKRINPTRTPLPFPCTARRIMERNAWGYHIITCLLTPD